MEPKPDPESIPIGEAAKRIVRRLLATGENRIELLMLELHEERQKVIQNLLLAVAAAAFGFLALVVLTGAIVVMFWNSSPVAALLILTALYALIAIILSLRISQHQKNWHPFSASLDQLKKDRAGFEKLIL